MPRAAASSLVWMPDDMRNDASFAVALSRDLTCVIIVCVRTTVQVRRLILPLSARRRFPTAGLRIRTVRCKTGRVGKHAATAAVPSTWPLVTGAVAAVGLLDFACGPLRNADGIA